MYRGRYCICGPVHWLPVFRIRPTESGFRIGDPDPELKLRNRSRPRFFRPNIYSNFFTVKNVKDPGEVPTQRALLIMTALIIFIPFWLICIFAGSEAKTWSTSDPGLDPTPLRSPGTTCRNIMPSLGKIARRIFKIMYSYALRYGIRLYHVPIVHCTSPHIYVCGLYFIGSEFTCLKKKTIILLFLRNINCWIPLDLN